MGTSYVGAIMLSKEDGDFFSCGSYDSITPDEDPLKLLIRGRTWKLKIFIYSTIICNNIDFMSYH
jgi:hypothetical protein